MVDESDGEFTERAERTGVDHSPRWRDCRYEELIYTYLTVATAMTLSASLEGHSSIARFFKWDVSYICAPVDKIITDKRARGPSTIATFKNF